MLRFAIPLGLVLALSAVVATDSAVAGALNGSTKPQDGHHQDRTGGARVTPPENDPTAGLPDGWDVDPGDTPGDTSAGTNGNGPADHSYDGGSPNGDAGTHRDATVRQ